MSKSTAVATPVEISKEDILQAKDLFNSEYTLGRPLNGSTSDRSKTRKFIMSFPVSKYPSNDDKQAIIDMFVTKFDLQPDVPVLFGDIVITYPSKQLQANGEPCSVLNIEQKDKLSILASAWKASN